ncbi:DUF4259 domain-containing protein [Micromonospora sp. CB01531]|uniref:DUF4259 domain-containing protein n=1 Tax=Micromonospora sp. CB01531 TaxID=1718947 RepID=UPI00093F3078|nr:DUF4259 domain-containing protein [Micromonospora sp. CB01531]OKI47505.1 hypothetical protein A6A27_36650 [Micromonospora sp. CB01531]
MGTWDSGPFDNDTAADWCGDLDDADVAKRPVLVREALSRSAGEDGYLDADVACEAIAAAAIVAAQQPGGQPITSPYAPDFLLDGGRLDLPDAMVVLAVRALDRLMAADPEWRDRWQDAAAGDVNRAFDAVCGLRRVVTA